VTSTEAQIDQIEASIKFGYMKFWLFVEDFYFKKWPNLVRDCKL
jgi:hypothetical protein